VATAIFISAANYYAFFTTIRGTYNEFLPSPNLINCST
jgi:hypothetical protein